MDTSRKTNQKLVVVNSTIWLSVVMLCIAAVVACVVARSGSPKGLLAVGPWLLFAFLAWRKEVVTFDAARQRAVWWRRRILKVATGTIPFSDITGIGTESIYDDHGRLSYRLTILTSGKPVPMSDGYGASQSWCESMREEILGFLKLDGKPPAPSEAIADEASIRSLLSQGRKMDAIELVRSNWQIDLTEAVARVNEIDEKMKAAK